MTRPRIALYSLGLIFLVLTSVSYYYYQNFSLIVEAQAKQHLHGYGVQKLRYERLRISSEQLRTDALHFSGEYTASTMLKNTDIPRPQFIRAQCRMASRLACLLGCLASTTVAQLIVRLQDPVETGL